MSLAMFTLITIHNCEFEATAPPLLLLTGFAVANVYRMLQAFVTIPSTDPSLKAPVVFLRDWATWDCYMFAVILALLTWMADVLVVSCLLVYF